MGSFPRPFDARDWQQKQGNVDHHGTLSLTIRCRNFSPETMLQSSN